MCNSIKKTCKLVQNKEIELLSFICSDLSDLKQTMTSGGKSYYNTFINNFSRYTENISIEK